LKSLYCWLRAVFADGIDNCVAALLACFLFGLTLIIVRCAVGITGLVVQPRRWVVERTLGWLGQWRRLCKDYETLPKVSEAMVTLAMISLMLHRIAHPNRKHLSAPWLSKRAVSDANTPSALVHLDQGSSPIPCAAQDLMQIDYLIWCI
jgi:putative transposase